MKNFAIYFGILLSLCLHATLCAQDESPSGFEKQKQAIMNEEREALRLEVEKINEREENGEISFEEATALKQQMAEKHALNIENRIAILENEQALKERNIAVVNFFDEEESNFELIIGKKSFRTSKKIKYDRRTTSDLVIAFGLNNVITEGEGLDGSDFKIGGSRFAELGWVWKTRIFENSNFLRLKYGVSFQFNGLKPTDNRVFVREGDETVLETFSHSLNKSKFRMDNLVFPVHFELGPSKKIERPTHIRYSTRNQFRIGLGGYAGFNLNTIQKLKYDLDGDRKKEKFKNDYNTNDLIYGLSAYLGWNTVGLYVKYDLNTIFKDNPVEQRNISLGLRFDLD